MLQNILICLGRIPVYEKFFDSELGVNFWIVLVYAH